jgi:hypothetical protein
LIDDRLDARPSGFRHTPRERRGDELAQAGVVGRIGEADEGFELSLQRCNKVL